MADRDKDDDKEPDDKSDAFDHEAESENLRRIGGADDEDDGGVDLDDPQDDAVDEPDDADPADAAHEGEDGGGVNDDADAGKGKRAAPNNAFQKRIDRLTAEKKQAADRADRAEHEVRIRDGAIDQSRRAGTLTAKAAVQAEIAAIEKDMEEAIEAGETKKQVELNTKLALASTRLNDVEGWLRSNPERQATDPGRQQQQPQRPGEAPRDRSKYTTAESKAWFDRNVAWLGDPARDQERRIVAELDAELANEGFTDWDDPARYKELQKRLIARAPHLKAMAKGPQEASRNGQRQQGRQRVAGVGRDSEGSTPRDTGGRSDLTAEDRRLMRTFKLDPGRDDHVKRFYKERKRMGG